ncbi:DUF3734 domain-containing protein [Massilia sp. B-10]|nr:DUF3734 domain-containing protein [Massilia sp. B-10]
MRVDGELYWDGGLYSNTPLESVLNELPSGDTICFMVDLWSADGAEPVTMDEVATRQKDVTFASRSQRHIDDYAVTHAMQRKLRDMYARLPKASRTPEDERELLALGCDATLHIVRLPYAGRDWHMAAKDVNFSKGSIEWRWDQGYKDAMRALKHLRLAAASGRRHGGRGARIAAALDSAAGVSLLAGACHFLMIRLLGLPHAVAAVGRAQFLAVGQVFRARPRPPPLEPVRSFASGVRSSWNQRAGSPLASSSAWWRARAGSTLPSPLLATWAWPGKASRVAAAKASPGIKLCMTAPCSCF